MINLSALRAIKDPKILVVGNHAGIVQSILDFDYLAGKATPSIVGIVGAQQKVLRYFWGNSEILVPVFQELSDLDAATRDSVQLFVVAQSGRRAATIAGEVITEIPNALGGMIFAEQVPEQQALELRRLSDEYQKFVLGPASVGVVVAGLCKVGAIGGTLPDQIIHSGILSTKGTTAVISTSGGMINELITMTSRAGSGITFAAAVGGERYPLTKPLELLEQAIQDEATKAILYFGELGGSDEYDIAEYLKHSPTNKPIIAYIAGVIAEKFEAAPQFGHAKAMAQNKAETATAKKAALREVGVKVADSFAEFEKLTRDLPKSTIRQEIATLEVKGATMEDRKPALFVDRITSDKGGDVTILGTPLDDYVANRSLSEIALSMFLGTQPKSQKLIDFFDQSLRLLVDHGPQVSGAVNTMITARAGKDLTAALASGILTIGPRFGGAINEAAANWLKAVNDKESADDFVERFASNKQYIPGIGHKKYRLDNPDPRVAALTKKFGNDGKYVQFARQVEAITTAKKAQLILNVDGLIAALLLDILETDEGYTTDQMSKLIQIEFCNAIFVYARSVGLIAHYLEQRRLDEGLFRLPDELITG